MNSAWITDWFHRTFYQERVSVSLWNKSREKLPFFLSSFKGTLWGRCGSINIYRDLINPSGMVIANLASGIVIFPSLGGKKEIRREDEEKEGEASLSGAQTRFEERASVGLAKQPRGWKTAGVGRALRCDTVGVRQDWLFADVKLSSTLPPTHVVRTFAPRVLRRTRTLNFYERTVETQKSCCRVTRFLPTSKPEERAAKIRSPSNWEPRRQRS